MDSQEHLRGLKTYLFVKFVCSCIPVRWVKFNRHNALLCY